MARNLQPVMRLWQMCLWVHPEEQTIVCKCGHIARLVRCVQVGACGSRLTPRPTLGTVQKGATTTEVLAEHKVRARLCHHDSVMERS